MGMLDMATSGAYYISLPADCIVAHPTTITGSVGVIFIRPQVYGLLDKIGVSVHADTSGRNKDMGSPFRRPTPEEDKLFSKLVEDLAGKFTSKVAENRKISPENMKLVATARVFTADDALAIGLVDKTGYMEDAVAKAKELAKLPADAKLVIYRRDSFPNDNPYNLSTSGDPAKPLVDTGSLGRAASAKAGFYYLWDAATP
jgi:protease-4